MRQENSVSLFGLTLGQSGVTDFKEAAMQNGWQIKEMGHALDLHCCPILKAGLGVPGGKAWTTPIPGVENTTVKGVVISGVDSAEFRFFGGKLYQVVYYYEDEGFECGTAPDATLSGLQSSLAQKYGMPEPEGPNTGIMVWKVGDGTKDEVRVVLDADCYAASSVSCRVCYTHMAMAEKVADLAESMLREKMAA